MDTAMRIPNVRDLRDRRSTAWESPRSKPRADCATGAKSAGQPSDRASADHELSSHPEHPRENDRCASHRLVLNS